MKDIKLSAHDMGVIAHSLGINLYGSILADEKWLRTLPKEFYRNYLAFNSGDMLGNKLVHKGLVYKTKCREGYIYTVTDKGIALFRSEFAKVVQYYPVKKRNLESLKERLNSYCWYCGYNFGKDNASHIIKYFNEYWLKKHYVSHTTKDVILQFKTDLKRYAKYQT